jgi:hypothetical protein
MSIRNNLNIIKRIYHKDWNEDDKNEDIFIPI